MARHKRSLGFVFADTFIYGTMVLAALLCLIPILNVLAVSLSSSTAAAAGSVKLWPVDLTTSSYQYALTKPQFTTSFMVSVQRSILGLAINMTLTVLVAYPLSLTQKQFRVRHIYFWFIFFTSIFNGGLIPTYQVVNRTGIANTLMALIIPGALPVFNVIVLMNFFRKIPVELAESARIDGAGHTRILRQIYLPLAIPSLAALSLFVFVGHWNAWFDGLIYMKDPNRYPLQTYLRSLLVVMDSATVTAMQREELELLAQVSDRTLKSAQIFIASLPILVAYPFVQKYFIKGLTLGGVKG